MSTKDIHRVRELLDSPEYMFRCEIGVAGVASNLSLEDCSRIIAALAKYYTIIKPKAQLDQIICGLKIMGVHELMMKCSKEFRKVMTSAKLILDADYIFNLFNTEFSEPGANKRDREEEAIMYWTNFIQMIECEFF